MQVDGFKIIRFRRTNGNEARRYVVWWGAISLITNRAHIYRDYLTIRTILFLYFLLKFTILFCSEEFWFFVRRSVSNDIFPTSKTYNAIFATTIVYNMCKILSV